MPDSSAAISLWSYSTRLTAFNSTNDTELTHTLTQTSLNMSNLKQIAIVIATMCFASTAMAQKPVIYPAKGQSSQQQSEE